MNDLFLTLLLAAMLIFGFFVMKYIDSSLAKYYKGFENEPETETERPQNAYCGVARFHKL